MDPHSPSPAVRVEQSSPLDSLVRRASSRRAKVAKLADALNVPYSPPRFDQGLSTVEDFSKAPHSPLLHTQFRGSVSTYDESVSGDGNTSLAWESPGRTTQITRSPYQPPDARAVSMASQYSVDSHASIYGGSRDKPGNVPGDVPTVIVSPDAEPFSPPHIMPTAMRQQSYGTSNSRIHPPPLGSDEQKREVLRRHAHPHAGAAASSRRPSAASEQTRPTFQQSLPAPPPRSNSQLSVYTSYSYYPYDGQIPSPSGSTTRLSPTNPLPSPTIAIRPPSPIHDNPSSPTTPNTNPQSAQEFLQLGIQHHLANRLDDSALCFEKSATVGGGCGMGMLMWGLAQRHGWGCTQSEAKGFKWLRRAAELAVNELEHKRAGMDSGAIKSELVLAIYEVGQSFLRGWGVDKDKQMAVKYFRLASELGDPDAQQELAFCLANGKGCKKDRKEAAKWYRAAVAQGVSDVGLAWIYKEKYQ